ncbi:MAG: ABC transporter substrate-binding protein [Tissierellia bacterium]|nr:ABC transporter substrate-binding protein [Tissierellia bacterium]
MKKKFSNSSKCIKFLIMILVLSLALVGCQDNDNTPTGEANTDNQIEDVAIEDTDDEIIDEDTGLVYESSMDLKYAESFSVDYYKGGYKTITDWTGRKTLLVPEGKEIPEVKDGVDIIQLPLETIGAFSTTIATELRPLDLMDKLSLVTTDIDKWHIPEIKEMMEEGKITYVGKNSAPDYELIQAANPDLILISSGTSHGGNETIEKFDELGVKWIGHGNQRETDPRGRLEWIKLSGALFDKEKEAEDFFNAQLKKIEEVEGKLASTESEVKTFATTFLSGDVYYVRNKGDYEVKMFELAGGEYIFRDLNPDMDGNTKMNAEELYKGIADVDIFFYNNINGPSIQSISDLIDNADYLGDVKAVKEGNVWGFKSHYYQSGDNVADMINDLYTILTTPQGEITETEYYFLMD